MKSLLRGTLVNALSLFFLTLLLTGVEVKGGLATYLTAGVVLTFVYKIIKPIVSIISLPINIITLGFSSFLINILLFYLATSLIPEISITPFTLNGFSFAGFVIPTINLNAFFAYAVAALFHSVIATFISWLRK